MHSMAKNGHELFNVRALVAWRNGECVTNIGRILVDNVDSA